MFFLKPVYKVQISADDHGSVSDQPFIIISPAVGDFYGTGIEIWAGFGPVGITERKEIWADYEQLFRAFF